MIWWLSLAMIPAGAIVAALGYRFRRRFFRGWSSGRGRPAITVGTIMWIAGGVVFFCISAATGLSFARPANAGVADTFSEHPLRALSAGTEMQGSFFLGSGTIDGEQVFRYLVDEADGYSVLKDVEAKRAKVREIEGPATLTLARTCEWPWWLMPSASWACSQPLYLFDVPPGSITTDYEVTP